MLNLPPKKSEDKMCSSRCPKPTCTKWHRARLSSRCRSGKHRAKRVGLGKRSCVSRPGNGVSGNWNLGANSSAKLPSLAIVQSAARKAKVTAARVPARAGDVHMSWGRSCVA